MPRPDSFQFVNERPIPKPISKRLDLQESEVNQTCRISFTKVRTTKKGRRKKTYMMNLTYSGSRQYSRYFK